MQNKNKAALRSSRPDANRKTQDQNLSASPRFGNRSDDWLLSGDWLAAGEKFKYRPLNQKRC